MYQEFNLTDIVTDSANKQIIIQTNKAINSLDKDSVVIEVFERKTKTPLTFDFNIDFNKLIITLINWPIPNIEYIISVKGLKSLENEELDSNIKRRITFESSVLSTVEITSPIMFEKVDELNIKLNEINNKNDDELINKYYIQISKDTSFFETVNEFISDKDSIITTLKDVGQYYIRARVQKDENNYSEWSNIISFIYKKENRKEEYPNIPDEDIHVDIDIDSEEPDIIIEDPLQIIEIPEQGITPEESFLFIFNNAIDDFSIDEIIVTRKDVR